LRDNLLPHLEKILTDNKSGFYVGAKVREGHRWWEKQKAPMEEDENDNRDLSEFPRDA
jgi:hypothetical protein